MGSPMFNISRAKRGHGYNSSKLLNVVFLCIGHRECGRSCVRAKYYKIVICSFSNKHTALRRKSKYFLLRNQDNVSEWKNMSIRGLLFQ